MKLLDTLEGKILQWSIVLHNPSHEIGQFVFSAMIKHYDQKQLGEQKVYLAYTSQGTVQHEGLWRQET